MMQTVANVLQCIMRTKELTLQQQAKQDMDNALATVMHATRCAVNNTMKTSMGALIFRREIIVDVPIMVDLIAIRNNRQQLSDLSNKTKLQALRLSLSTPTLRKGLRNQ